MTTIDAAVFAGFLGALMGLIELAKTLAKRRGDARNAAVAPPDPCLECRTAVATTAETTRRVLAAVEANTEVQRELASTIREWIAEERGRRDALRRAQETSVRP